MSGETAQLCSCDICLESFYSNKELMNHRKQEHPQQAHACYICDKAFSTPSRLYMHKYFEHSSKEYACTCGKKFKRKATLKEHQEKYCRKGGRELKDLDQCGPRQRQRRLKDIIKNFEESIKGFSEKERKSEFLKLVKKNPEVLDISKIKLKDKMTEEDIVEFVRDINLSDRQCMKIVAKMREKWGKEVVSQNVAKALVEMKRKLSHLFTCTLLHKDGPIHFTDSQDNPITRHVVYCNDLTTLTYMKDVLEEVEGAFENVIGIDDGKNILKVCVCVYAFFKYV